MIDSFTPGKGYLPHSDSKRYNTNQISASMIQTTTQTKIHQRDVLYSLLLSAALVGFVFLLQENIGLDLADEGFLWYGAIRTAHGDVPFRDFQSYDPGRYFWVAAWFLIFGQGIIALRLSVALFQVIGLTLGLLAVRRVVTNWWLLSLIGLLLVAWMFPRHKLFESSLAMAAIYVAVLLIEKPTHKQYFVAGLFVGLAAFMGRNHGLYNLLAFFCLILYIQFKFNQEPLLNRLGLWLTGIAVGYAPMLFMLAFIPGLSSSFTNEIMLIFRRGSTNLPLPIPWPWAVDYAQLDLLNCMTRFFVGVLFLLLPLFYLSNIISAFSTKRDDIPRQSLTIAASFVGVFYMHHAFSRADLPHLAQGIHPLLIGLVALPYTYRVHRHKGVVMSLATFILIATIFAAIIPANPYVRKLRAKDQFIQYDITGDQLWLNQDQAAYIDTIKQLVNQHIAPQEKLLIAPHSPGLYPILQRQSPIWDLYLLSPAQEERQVDIINDLIEHNVNWVILADVPLDGRDELRFRHTHPLVWQYIVTEFEPIEASGLPHNQKLFHRDTQKVKR